MPGHALAQKADTAFNALGANNWLEIYELGTTPAYTYGVVNLRLSNKSGTDLTFDVAVGAANPGVDPVNKDIVVSGNTLTGHGVYELTNMVIGPGESIFVRPSATTLDARLDGLLFNTTTNLLALGSTEVLQSDGDKTVYTMPNGTTVVFGTVNLYLCNLSGSSTTVTVKTGNAAGPHGLVEIESGITIPSNSEVQRLCLVLGYDEKIIVNSSAASGLIARVSGISHVVPPSP